MKRQLRESVAPPSATVAVAAYARPGSSGSTGMMTAPGGRTAPTWSVVLSTVRIATGPSGPLRLAPASFAAPTLSAMTNRFGPVVKPAGRSTKSPGVKG